MARRPPGFTRRASMLMGRALAQAGRIAYRGAVRDRLSASLTRRRVVTRPRIRLARGHRDLDGLRLAFLYDVHAANYLDEAVVLLAHHPDFFAESAPRIDLQLSGHTHGGQIMAFGRTPLRHTRHGYWSGHFTRGAAQLYVGRGVGTSFLPIRIGAPAEIAIVELVAG